MSSKSTNIVFDRRIEGRQSGVKIKYERGKLLQKLRRQIGSAIADYNMIEEGDRVLVCMSGGKDSYTLLDILEKLRKKAPVNFELLAFHLDQRQPGYPAGVMDDYLKLLGVNYKILDVDTFSIVQKNIPDGKTKCGLCSRLRRGIIYKVASEHKIDKIALGHHRDDIVETLFLNMFFGSKLKAMPPKLRSDDGEHVVIRPLSYCKESDLLEYSNQVGFPIIPCNLCGSQKNLQRVKIKRMLAEWESSYPGRVENIFKSLKSVIPSHLADKKIYDFEGLSQESLSVSSRWVHQK